MQLRPLSRRPTAAAAAPTEDAAAAESEAGVAIDSPTSLRAFMQALQSKADELRTLANSLSPTDSAQVDDAHSAVQRLRAFVAIGHQLSEEYVKLLGTQPGGSQGGVPRALASHVVRAEVLLGSVTATRRAFECAEVPLGTELVELQDAVRVLRQCALDADTASRQHTPAPPADSPDGKPTADAVAAGALSTAALKEQSISGLQSNIQEQRQRLSTLMERVATLRKLASSLEANSAEEGQRGAAALQGAAEELDKLRALVQRAPDPAKAAAAAAEAARASGRPPTPPPVPAQRAGTGHEVALEDGGVTAGEAHHGSAFAAVPDGEGGEAGGDRGHLRWGAPPGAAPGDAPPLPELTFATGLTSSHLPSHILPGRPQQRRRSISNLDERNRRESRDFDTTGLHDAAAPDADAKGADERLDPRRPTFDTRNGAGAGMRRRPAANARRSAADMNALAPKTTQSYGRSLGGAAESHTEGQTDSQTERRPAVARKASADYSARRGGHGAAGEQGADLRRRSSGARRTAADLRGERGGGDRSAASEAQQEESAAAERGEAPRRRPPVLRRQSPDYSARRGGGGGRDPENERRRTADGGASTSASFASQQSAAETAGGRVRASESPAAQRGAPDYGARRSSSRGGDADPALRRRSSSARRTAADLRGGQSGASASGGDSQVAGRSAPPQASHAPSDRGARQPPVLRKRSADYGARRGGGDPENDRRRSGGFSTPPQADSGYASNDARGASERYGGGSAAWAGEGRTEALSDRGFGSGRDADDAARRQPPVLRRRSPDYSARRGGSTGRDPENERRFTSDNWKPLALPRSSEEPRSSGRPDEAQGGAPQDAGRDRDAPRRQPPVLRKRSTDYSARRGGGGDPENARRRSDERPGGRLGTPPAAAGGDWGSGGDLRPSYQSNGSSADGSAWQTGSSNGASGEQARRPPVLRRRSPEYGARRGGSAGRDPENERRRSSEPPRTYEAPRQSEAPASPSGYWGGGGDAGNERRRSGDYRGGNESPQRSHGQAQPPGSSIGFWSSSVSGSERRGTDRSEPFGEHGMGGDRRPPVLRRSSPDYGARRGGSSGRDPENERRRSGGYGGGADRSYQQPLRSQNGRHGDYDAESSRYGSAQQGPGADAAPRGYGSDLSGYDQGGRTLGSGGSARSGRETSYERPYESEEAYGYGGSSYASHSVEGRGADEQGSERRPSPPPQRRTRSVDYSSRRSGGEEENRRRRYGR